VKYHCNMKQVNIKHLINLHHDALRGLDFYKQELAILQRRLEEISADNTGHEVSERIEYFQNQFLIHAEQIDELRHAFHENAREIERHILESAGFAGESSIIENEDLYERYVTEEKMFNELRHEFNPFAAKWM
jgi:hypothetical protein